MRRGVLAAAGLCLAIVPLAAGITRSYARSVPGLAAPTCGTRSTVAGITWETSIESAKARAQQEQKLIFLLHLFGRLDEEFC
jgi:hypothetical protein